MLVDGQSLVWSSICVRRKNGETRPFYNHDIESNLSFFDEDLENLTRPATDTFSSMRAEVTPK